MGTTLLSNLSLSAGISALLATGTVGAAQYLTNSPKINPTLTPSVGTSGGNINLMYAENLTVTSGTPFTINVSTGADAVGNTLSMAHVLGIAVVNLSTTSGQDLTVGGGTTPVFGSTLIWTVQSNANTPAGSIFFSLNTSPGFAISTNVLLQVTVAAGTSVPFQLAILGCTA